MAYVTNWEILFVYAQLIFSFNICNFILNFLFNPHVQGVQDLISVLLTHFTNSSCTNLSHWIFVSLCDFCFLFFSFLHDNDSASTTYYYLFTHVCTAELGLNAEVTKLVNECEQSGLVQSLLLPEDLALRHLPALSIAHRRLDFTRRNPSLSPLQEVGTQDLNS